MHSRVGARPSYPSGNPLRAGFDRTASDALSRSPITYLLDSVPHRWLPLQLASRDENHHRPPRFFGGSPASFLPFSMVFTGLPIAASKSCSARDGADSWR